MFFTKKWLTTHIEREHQLFEPNMLDNVNNKSTDTNANVSKCENRANDVIGPRNVGKTLLHAQST